VPAIESVGCYLVRCCLDQIGECHPISARRATPTSPDWQPHRGGRVSPSPVQVRELFEQVGPARISPAEPGKNRPDGASQNCIPCCSRLAKAARAASWRDGRGLPGASAGGRAPVRSCGGGPRRGGPRRRGAYLGCTARPRRGAGPASAWRRCWRREQGRPRPRTALDHELNLGVGGRPSRPTLYGRPCTSGSRPGERRQHRSTTRVEAAAVDLESVDDLLADVLDQRAGGRQNPRRRAAVLSTPSRLALPPSRCGALLAIAPRAPPSDTAAPTSMTAPPSRMSARSVMASECTGGGK